MGVEGLSTLIKRYAPEVAKEGTYADYAGQKWGIDASGFFYRFCHDPQSKKVNPHVDGFYQLFYRLYRHGIQPIMVFDGKKPKEKLHTVQEREKKKQEQEDLVKRLKEELNTILGESSSSEKPLLDWALELSKNHPKADQIKAKIDAIKEASKHMIVFQDNYYQEVIDLCHLMKVPYYRAEWEADALLTKLSETGQIDAVMSEDSDILLYHGKRLMRKFKWSMTIEKIELSDLLSKLSLTYLQFVDLCILCGTDYTVKEIGGMGAIRAYEHIKAGLTIEEIINRITLAKDGNTQYKSFKKYVLPEDISQFDYQSARDLIKNAHAKEAEIIIPPTTEIDTLPYQDLIKYMSEKCKYQIDTTAKHQYQLCESKPLFQSKKTTVAKIVLKKLTLSRSSN